MHVNKFRLLKFDFLDTFFFFFNEQKKQTEMHGDHFVNKLRAWTVSNF